MARVLTKSEKLERRVAELSRKVEALQHRARWLERLYRREQALRARVEDQLRGLQGDAGEVKSGRKMNRRVRGNHER
jgi:chromosome segregation ATPase